MTVDSPGDLPGNPPGTGPGEQRQPLARDVKVLSAVSLAQDAGSEMLYPLLPKLLTGVLGAPVVALGVAEGLADAVAAVMKLVAGRFARPGTRKRWIAVGYGLAAIGKAIIAIAFVWPVVVVGRVVDRIGKGIRGVPRDAVIADVTPAAQRGRAFGFHRAADTLGAVIGPLIALALLAALHDHVRPALAIALVPATISVLLVALVREDRSPATRPDGSPPQEAGEDRRLPTAFWRVLAPLGVFALVNSTDALLLQRAGQLGLSLTAVVAVYVVYNAVYALTGYPAGALSDRVPPRLLVGGGLLVFAAVYIGLGRAHSAAAVWVLLPLYGLYAALTDGVARAWIAGLVDRPQRTWALGVHSAVTGAGALAAGLWSGLAWGHDGRLPLTVSGVVAAAVGLWLLVRREPANRPASTSAPR